MRTVDDMRQGETPVNEIILGDCLKGMRKMPDGCVDLVVTDPPYGCGKADWDRTFPLRWYTEARRIARMVIIITGSCGLSDSIPLVGEDFIDVLAGWNMNSGTRSPVGFSNWIAAVIAGGKPKMGQNVLRFTTKREMIGGDGKLLHPTPKPIAYMTKLINRVSTSDELIVDPFAGSGTTLVACKQLGRRFIGFEINPKYVSICKQRLAQGVLGLT